MNRHTTMDAHHGPYTAMGSYHERNCTRALFAHRRAVTDGRHADALVFAVEALTLADVGYGGQLPPGALAELRDALDASDGVRA